MIWIAFALLTALCESLKDVFSKKGLANIDEYVIFQMLAVSLTLVAHVIAIKRTSTMMSVLWGYWIFKERGIKERLLGAGIMVVGVLLISLL